MAVAEQVLVLLHLIGFAGLLGGVLVQLRVVEPEVNLAMLLGAWAELATGIALLVLAETGPQRVAYAPLVTKLVVTALVVLLVAKNRKFASIPRGLLAIIAALTLVNTVIPVVWT